VEVCHNPLKVDCESNDIVVYIQVGSEKLPICRSCWRELAESDLEWGEEGLKDAQEKSSQLQSKELGMSGAGERFLEGLSKNIGSTASASPQMRRDK